MTRSRRGRNATLRQARKDARRRQAERCAARLNLEMLRKGVTRDEVAAKARVTRTTVDRWMAALNRPSRHAVFELAQWFDCDPAWLYGLDDEAAA